MLMGAEADTSILQVVFCTSHKYPGEDYILGPRASSAGECACHWIA